MLALGAAAAVVTLGHSGRARRHRETRHRVRLAPVAVAPRRRPDRRRGTRSPERWAARLAAGDTVLEAARLGTAAAALSLAGAGGTGRVPTLAESRAALAGVPTHAGEPRTSTVASARGAEQGGDLPGRGRDRRTDLVGRAAVRVVGQLGDADRADGPAGVVETAAPTQRTPASFSSSSTDHPRARTSARWVEQAVGSR